MNNFFKKIFGIDEPAPKPSASKSDEIAQHHYYPNPITVKESEIQKFIRESTPKEVEKWFEVYKSKGHYFFDSIYYAVQDKIASSEDDYYLSLLKDIDADEAKEFLKEEKEAGTYFSDKVYDTVLRKMNQDKNREYLDSIEEMTPEKTLTWFLKMNDKNGFDFLDPEIEIKAHDKILTIFQKGKIAKTYQKKLFDYCFYSITPHIDEIMKSDLYSELITSALEEEKTLRNKGLLFRRLGEASELKGDLLAAIENFKAALEAADEDLVKGIEAQKLGECLIKAGKTDLGIQSLSIAAKFQPSQEAKIYRRIGEIYEDKGDFKKVIEFFEKAMAVNPKIGVKSKLAKYQNQLKEGRP
ncbi:MAG: hypothetical protein K9J37_13540 [Saprospiraceae bacterium]|nr:hypothetical protein [Saprospiraceae bacterium]MCF8250932.1 hypothetical protein [Saprospiraceae bacterium]MCF8281910.1 hypothetical protein [Bacteroidales bacterium]MCF8311897.1 hypothetical protein [Saprospiraceae bacterium]MCF8441905.1 hypothetical protein [Saprospiraceae bacterium]